MASPNINDTYLGAGRVEWKGSADPSYRHLGEVDMFAVTGNVERKDFYSKLVGKRRKARSVVGQEQATCRFRMREVNPENLGLFFLGSVTSGPPAVVQIMDLGEVNGALRFVGTNDVGEKLQCDLPNVNLAPNGDFDFLADDWGGMEITAEVIADPSTGSFGEIRDISATGSELQSL